MFLLDTVERGVEVTYVCDNAPKSGNLLPDSLRVIRESFATFAVQALPQSTLRKATKDAKTSLPSARVIEF